MITVVHCKKEPDSEYIGRPSPLGNPFTHRIGRTKADVVVKTRSEAIEKYRVWLDEQIKAKNPDVCRELNRLYKIAKRGHLKLGCWCSPQACHGDVIKEVLESKL